MKKRDVAAAAQLHLENMMVNLLDFHLKNNNVERTNLMCAEGYSATSRLLRNLRNGSN